MEEKTMTKSKEDYLEAILMIISEIGACRVTDIAKQMEFSKASTSVALKKLEDEGYIIRDEWRILLTEKGKSVAEHIYERHHFFTEWFRKIGVNDVTAEEDACKVEHVLSQETFEKIREFAEANS